MSSKKINKAYISDVDKFLHALDVKFSKTASQQAEIDKHDRIAKLRDVATETIPTHKPLWEDF